MNKQFLDELESLKSRIEYLTEEHPPDSIAVYSQEDADNLRTIWGQDKTGYVVIVRPPKDWCSLSQDHVDEICKSYKRAKLPLPKELAQVLGASVPNKPLSLRGQDSAGDLLQTIR